jgi:hypothetical protein
MQGGWNRDFSASDVVVVSDSITGNTVRVTTQEIDAVLHQSLDRYVRAGFRPDPVPGSTGWHILSAERIRTDAPAQAQSFVYEYTDAAGNEKIGEEQWYVLGRHLLTVAAVTDRSLWPDSDSWREIVAMQESFEPAIHTSLEYAYSLGHPTYWVEDTSRSYDYLTGDPASTDELHVEVISARDYSSVVEYGDDHTVFGSQVIARRPVYTKRANPSYRIDYVGPPREAGSRQRGAALITMGGGNAIWVSVEATEDNWARVGPLVEEIFLKVAVRP